MKPRLRMGTTLPALVLAIAAALPAQASSFTPLDEQGRATYLVTFPESGLLAEHRQRNAGAKFNFEDPAIVQAREQLEASQAAHLAGISSALGRSLSASHHFLITQSGVALRLSEAEAVRLRSLPGVAGIEREQEYPLDTYRGPAFIGAETVWDGTGVPGGAPTFGQGMVAAIMDTGIVAGHPSFANDATCGFSGAQPKVLSSLDCGATNGSGMCNGASPDDTNGHGSHTASTVAGNRLGFTVTPAPAYEISGMAPCASIRSYKTCPTITCPGANVLAGLNSAMAHGDVDVVNFSIGGGTNPWSDDNRTFLDMVNQGMFVAASAGNNSQADPTVVGRVQHRGPWVMSVAASTRDGDFSGEVVANGQTYAALHGPNSPAGNSETNLPIRFDPNQVAGREGCNVADGGVPFPANFFDGSVALIQRGTCAFTDKVNNAAAAGAMKVLIWNNATGGIRPITPGQVPGVSTYGIEQAAGQAIRNYITANPGSAVIDLTVIPSQGDILADFSYRGPTPGNLADIQKPDITGPGVDIYAATTDASGYGNISGTSMSSPHIAGAGLLVAQVHPDWTPSEIKSALQMSAHKDGTKENGTTPWDTDDVGHGRAMVNRAVNAGLVLDETFANYLAANPANGGDVRTLNVPGLRDRNCSPNCSWTRTVRNTLGTASSWTATGAGVTANMNITVSPSTFTFTGDTDETQVLTITATPVDNLVSTIGFGEVVFAEAGTQSPDLRFTVAIQGEPAVLDIPRIELDQDQFVFVMNPDTNSSQTLNISNPGTQPLTWEITEAAPAAAPRGSYNPLMDEVLSIPNFTVNPASPQNFTVPGGVTSGGDVVGFTFQGTVTALAGFDYASDLRMVMTSPDSQSFDVGGFTSPANNWAFQGSGSASPGTYTSTHLGSFNDAQSIGNWGFVFTHGYSSGGNMPWQNVTVTLHKTGIPSACFDPSDIPWLDVTPNNGTIAPTGSTAVSIDVDTTGLATGDYSAIVCVASNDPNQGLLEVPVSLTVMDGTIEPAAIEVSETAYSFALVGGAVGESGGDELVISNTGDLPLSWVIDTAGGSAQAGDYQPDPNATRQAGPQPLLGTLDGSVQVFAENAVVNAGRGTTGPTLSVDGKTTNGILLSGDAGNSQMMLPIGVGNALTGLGWEVTVTAHDPSWRNESRVAFRSSLDATTGLFITPLPGAANNSPGTGNSSSGGILDLAANSIAPVQADASGLLYLTWYESYNDPEVNPDATWADLAGGVLPPGLRLICTDQAACDAAVSGTTPPASCDSPSEISWLDVNPAAGLTTGGNSTNVAISVNAAGLDGGTYEALLCVGSNDATNPLIEIPVVLEVTAPAQISVAPAAINAEVAANASDTVSMAISNLGGADLDWSILEGQNPAHQPSLNQAPASSSSIADAISFLAAGGRAQSIATLPGVRGTFDCVGAEGLHILDDGSIENGYSHNTTVSQSRFVQAYDVTQASLLGTVCVSFVSLGPSSLNYEVAVFAADGAGGAPGTELGAVSATASGMSTGLPSSVLWHAVDLSSLNLLVQPGRIYIGVRFAPSSPNVFIASDESAASPAATGYVSTNTTPAWELMQAPNYEDYKALFIRPQFVGAAACDNPQDVPWLSVNPTSGTTAGGGSSNVDVTLNATGLTPGVYEAALCITSNDPLNPLVVVPVTMEVPLGEDGAIVEGTVESLGYCSTDPAAAAGAQVVITGANGSFNTTTDANGHYQVIMHIDESPVTVAVTAAGHIGASETGVVLVAEESVTVNFSLELDAPCATANPEALGITLAPDSVGSETLTLNNAGAASYTWTIDIEEVLSANPFSRGTVNVVADGGFELGEPNPEWDEESSTFGTVLCDAGCNQPGGTAAPHGGTWWVWFGGIQAGDTGHAAQMVTLPVGSSAELRFFLRIPDSGQTGYMRVSLGGDQLFEVTQANAASYPTYQEVVIDVSAYADGGTYELRFDSVTLSGAGTTNFFLDDVSLLVQPGPLDCADPQGVDWLLVDEDSGSVAAHSSEAVEVLYDSTGLSNGEYQANLCVGTSDSQNDLIVIPVTLGVVSSDIFADGFEGDDVPRPVQSDGSRRIRH